MWIFNVLQSTKRICAYPGGIVFLPLRTYKSPNHSKVHVLNGSDIGQQLFGRLCKLFFFTYEIIKFRLNQASLTYGLEI